MPWALGPESRLALVEFRGLPPVSLRGEFTGDEVVVRQPVRDTQRDPSVGAAERSKCGFDRWVDKM